MRPGAILLLLLYIQLRAHLYARSSTIIRD
jgi:hypothetical protein